MVVVWGQPVNSTEHSVLVASSWPECVGNCYEDDFCVMAHGNMDFCWHYTYGSVFEAEQLTSDDGVKIAVKASYDYFATCPTTPNNVSPQTVTMKNSSDPYKNFDYTITITGDLWNFSYQTIPFCPPDWKQYQRPAAKYCMRVFTNFNKTFTQAVATADCTQYNATLSGFETNEERLWSLGQVNNVISEEVKYTRTAIWVSGIRKENCMDNSKVNNTDCQGTRAFTFSDTYLKTLGGYAWAPDQPDSLKYRQVQNCIQMWVEKKPTTLHGLLDDVQCDLTNNTAKSFEIRGYVCGKIAGI
uniref:PAN-3 domain-containing protein n=1 Tax=Caenorhabditis japonica TaxID=281687 RepID=A0A8R1I7C1_CAEJA